MSARWRCRSPAPAPTWSSMRTRADKKGDRYVLNGSQDVDHQRPGCRDAGGLRQDRSGRRRARHHRVPDREGDEGLLHRAEARQARHARLRHLRAGVRGLRGAGGERARQGRRRRQRADVAASTTSASCSRPGRSASCRRASTWCMPYVHERKQFGQPIGEFQLMQGKLADMYVDDERRARPTSMRWRAPATRPAPRARTPPARSSTPPRTRPRWRSTRSSASAATATSTTIPTGRLLRDAKLYEIGAGTSEIRRMLIGRELSTKAEAAVTQGRPRSGCPGSISTALEGRKDPDAASSYGYLQGSLRSHLRMTGQESAVNKD